MLAKGVLGSHWLLLVLIPKWKCLVGAGRIGCSESGTSSTVNLYMMKQSAWRTWMSCSYDLNKMNMCYLVVYCMWHHLWMNPHGIATMCRNHSRPISLYFYTLQQQCSLCRSQYSCISNIFTYRTDSRHAPCQWEMFASILHVYFSLSISSGFV